MVKRPRSTRLKAKKETRNERGKSHQNRYTVNLVKGGSKRPEKPWAWTIKKLGHLFKGTAAWWKEGGEVGESQEAQIKSRSTNETKKKKQQGKKPGGRKSGPGAKAK